MLEIPEINSADKDPNLDRGRHASRARSSNRTKQVHLYKFYVVYLLIALLVAIGALIACFAYYNVRLNNMIASMTAQKEETLRAQSDLEAVVKGKLPSVRALIPDQVLTFNDGLIKNITFNVTHQDNTEKYEFRLVTENRGLVHLRPKFKIMVFSRNGLQIGGHDNNELSTPDLAPGESRSFTGLIEMILPETPAYFLIDLKDSDPVR